MKKIFLLILFLYTNTIHAADGMNQEPNNSSFQESLLTRAKKKVGDINLRNLIDLAPFALVAKCYSESPNLTMVMLGVTIIAISLRNEYIQRRVKRQYAELKAFWKKQKKAFLSPGITTKLLNG